MSDKVKPDTQTEVGPVPSRRRGWLRAFVWTVGLVATTMLVLTIILRLFFHGPQLADRIERQINPTIRGELRIGSVEWPTSAALTAPLGVWIPVTIHDLEVYDEFGELVLKTPLANAELDPHAAMWGADVVLRNITVHDGGYAKIKQVREPYPENEFDFNVVSLISAFYPARPPEFRAGLKTRPGAIFDLRDYDLRGVTMEFDFPEFYAIVYGIHAKGALRGDGSDPLASRLYYTLKPKAPLGMIRIGQSFEVLTDIEIGRLALVPEEFARDAFPRDLEYQLTARATGGALVNIRGAWLDHRVDYFGGEHDIELQIEDAAVASNLIARDIIASSSGGKMVPTGAMQSAAVDSLSATVKGPVMAPRVSLSVSDISYEQPVPGKPPIALTLEKATASFDLATESGSLENTVVRGLGGEVGLEAQFSLKPLRFSADLDITQPLELRPYLPPQVRKVIGSRLSGELTASGDPQSQALDKLSLRLGRAAVSGSAYRTASGQYGSDGRGLRISLDKTQARNLIGYVKTDEAGERNIDVRFDVESSDLGRLLTRLGYPAMAKEVNGFVRIGGTIEDLHGRGRLELHGVPVVDRLTSELSYSDQMITVDAANATSFGGSLSASGKIDLRDRATLRGFTLSGKNLVLDKLPVIGSALTGRGSLDAHIAGPVGALEGGASLSLSNWSIAGDRYGDTTIVGALSTDGAMSVDANIIRANGGRLEIDAGLDAAGSVQGDVKLGALPVSALLGLAGLDTRLAGGKISSHLELSGTPDAPTATGAIAATRAWLGEAFFGGVDVQVKRVDNGVVQVSGTLLQGRIQVDGSVATTMPFASDLELRFHRIELDQFMPELAERYRTRAWASGALTFRGDLMPGTQRQPQITARLTELEARLDNDDAQGRPAPLRVRSTGTVELSYDGTIARLMKPAELQLPGGKLVITGDLDGEKITASVDGKIALNLLRRYLGDRFEEIGGSVAVAVKLAGTVARPKITGAFTLDNVSVRPADQDAVVRIPVGKIELSENSLTTTGVTVVVSDEFSDEAAELGVVVTVSLKDYEPTEWLINAQGELGGKMLLVAAPDIFSAASGRAQISLTAKGTGLIPKLDGDIDFSDEDSLTITPRGLRREIRLTGGGVTFSGDEVKLESVAGWVADEGRIVDLSGDVSLEGLKPTSVDLAVTARDVPFRLPGVLLLSVNISDGQIFGNFEPGTPIEDRLRLEGRVDIIDGRYIERWSPVINNLRPQRTSESEPPIWETNPLIGNAVLAFKVESPAFFVRNNIADITMAGDLTIEGTPLDPKIEGEIRVEQGSFKIPTVRAEFTRTSGTVTFSKFRDFPTSTPELAIESESDYRDLRGQNHLVKLSLTGPLEKLSWDLSTANGLNRAQTLTLVFSGRTPADARRLFGDEPVGRRPGEYGSNLSTVDSEGTAAVLDRVAKDLVGDQLNRILGDPLQNLTKLDVVRFEVGTASLGMHLEKNVTQSFRLLGDAERTLRGWSWAARAENRFNDTVSLDLNGLAKRFDDEALDDESDLTLRLTWRKVLLP